MYSQSVIVHFTVDLVVFCQRWGSPWRLHKGKLKGSALRKTLPTVVQLHRERKKRQNTSQHDTACILLAVPVGCCVVCLRVCKSIQLLIHSTACGSEDIQYAFLLNAVNTFNLATMIIKRFFCTSIRLSAIKPPPSVRY